MAVPLSLSVARSNICCWCKSAACWVEAQSCLSPPLGGWGTPSHAQGVWVADKSPPVPLGDQPHRGENCLPPVPTPSQGTDNWIPGANRREDRKGQALSPNSGQVWRASPAPEFPEMEASWATEMQLDFSPCPVLLPPLPAGIDPRIRLHPNLSRSLLPGEMTYDTCPKSKS